MRGKLTYRQSQYLTCFKRPNATLTCKVQHTNHILRRRMCSSIHTSGEFGIALIKSKGRGEHARNARVAGEGHGCSPPSFASAPLGRCRCLASLSLTLTCLTCVVDGRAASSRASRPQWPRRTRRRSDEFAAARRARRVRAAQAGVDGMQGSRRLRRKKNCQLVLFQSPEQLLLRSRSGDAAQGPVTGPDL